MTALAKYTRYLNYAEELRTMADKEEDQPLSRKLLLMAASHYESLAQSELRIINSREALKACSHFEPGPG